MSWAGYGQGGAYGAPAGYGAQGAPSYGAQARPGYGAPQGAPGYGAPQGAPGYGAPQGTPGYGAPQGAPRGYGAPQGVPGGYGPPQGAPGGYGAPQGYGGGFGGGFGGQAPPPPGVSPELWMWFQSVDADRSGEITASELAQALMNGNWTPFNAETCRLMIGMFDRDRTGTINVQEFAALWKYIQDWKACFDRFDTDRSGNIDSGELQNAFSTFGYRLSPQFCQMCVRVFDRRHTNTMNFDDFIQCCVMLKSLTDQFREKDKSQSGIIDIGYEDFLKMVLDNSII